MSPADEAAVALRRFRHFFRHGYAAPLVWDRLRENAAIVDRLHDPTLEDLEALLAFLRETLARIEDSSPSGGLS